MTWLEIAARKNISHNNKNVVDIASGIIDNFFPSLDAKEAGKLNNNWKQLFAKRNLFSGPIENCCVVHPEKLKWELMIIAFDLQWEKNFNCWWIVLLTPHEGT